eukprot:scaffold85659_cov30-Phaeocystis_antarctica.AAC.1
MYSSSQPGEPHTSPAARRESRYSRVRMTRGLRDSGALGCGCARVAPDRARTGGCGTGAYARAACASPALA